MKMKTSELQGAALDWAVARCLGTEHLFAGHEVGRLHYSTDWAQGGPVIERERITLTHQANRWAAQTDDDLFAYGPTPLIAAMRCYVASKLGEEVDVPDDLVWDDLIYDKGDE